MDAYHVIGDDLTLDADNDLAIVSDIDETDQRLLRRLLTIKTSYIWNQDFGASVPKYIGEPLSLEVINQIKSDIKAELFKDAAVSKSPAPEINFQSLTTGFNCSIKYYNLDTDSWQSFSFEVAV